MPGRNKAKRAKAGGGRLVNEYDGWPGRDAATCPSLDLVDAADLTPEKFWKNYVAPRKPVIINGHPTDPSWRADRWDVDYLVKQAGDAPVEVEVRGSAAEGFGRGVKQRMPFAEALRRAAAGDDTLYLTTQKVSNLSDGHPDIWGEPLKRLRSDLPARPALLGSLCLQSVNVWMGCAPNGSSTGLHHDFHDNLYVLLAGRKRFRLWPPGAAPRMALRGGLRRIHANGRFVYDDQGDILPDGSDAAEAKLWAKRRDAEAALAAAEAAVARGDSGAEEALEAAEAQLDAELEAALGGPGAEDDFDDAWPEGLVDDYAEDEEEEESEEEEPARKQSKARGAGGSAAGKKRAAEEELPAEPEDPPGSFSAADLSLPDAQLRRRFPRFPGAASAAVADIAAGQMLYLPAGWFHEVTSFSGAAEGAAADQAAAGREQAKDGSKAAGGGLWEGPLGGPFGRAHLALNFWMHPPDNLDPSAGFKAPYTSAYWPDLWERRAAADKLAADKEGAA